MNWELMFADGAGTMWNMVPTHNGGLVLRYTEITWKLLNKGAAETLPPPWSITINLEPGYNLPYGRIHNFS